MGIIRMRLEIDITVTNKDKEITNKEQYKKLDEIIDIENIIDQILSVKDKKKKLNEIIGDNFAFKRVSATDNMIEFSYDDNDSHYNVIIRIERTLIESLKRSAVCLYFILEDSVRDMVENEFQEMVSRLYGQTVYVEFISYENNSLEIYTRVERTGEEKSFLIRFCEEKLDENL